MQVLGSKGPAPAGLNSDRLLLAVGKRAGLTQRAGAIATLLRGGVSKYLDQVAFRKLRVQSVKIFGDWPKVQAGKIHGGRISANHGVFRVHAAVITRSAACRLGSFTQLPLKCSVFPLNLDDADPCHASVVGDQVKCDGSSGQTGGTRRSHHSDLTESSFSITPSNQGATIGCELNAVGAALMGNTVTEYRREIRLLVTTLLITTSGTAGYYWGTFTSNEFAHQSDYLIAGFALVVCAILASTVLDIIHSRIDGTSEMHAHELERLARTNNTKDVAIKDMQRALDELTTENLRLMEQLSQKNHQLH